MAERSDPTPTVLSPNAERVLAALYVNPLLSRSAHEVAGIAELSGQPSPLVLAVNTLEDLARRGFVVRAFGGWALHACARAMMDLGGTIATSGLEGVRHG